MDAAVEQGWVWVDVSDPEHLDKTKTYRIAVGQEHWHLRYGGLHEWFASKVPGEHEIPANALVKAGCPIFIKRQPISWIGTAILKYEGDRLELEAIDGPKFPNQLDRLSVIVKITEILDPSAVPLNTATGEEVWSRH